MLQRFRKRHKGVRKRDKELRSLMRNWGPQIDVA